MMKYEDELRAEEIAAAGLLAMREQARKISSASDIAASFEQRWLTRAAEIVGTQAQGRAA